MPLGMEVGLSPGDFVLDGDPALPSTKRGGAPQFSAHVYGQAAGWMKTPLGTEVYLGPGHTAVRRAPTCPPPLAKGAQHPPIFYPCLL